MDNFYPALEVNESTNNNFIMLTLKWRYLEEDLNMYLTPEECNEIADKLISVARKIRSK